MNSKILLETALDIVLCIEKRKSHTCPQGDRAKSIRSNHSCLDFVSNGVLSLDLQGLPGAIGAPGPAGGAGDRVSQL